MDALSSSSVSKLFRVSSQILCHRSELPAAWNKIRAEVRYREHAVYLPLFSGQRSCCYRRLVFDSSIAFVSFNSVPLAKITNVAVSPAPARLYIPVGVAMLSIMVFYVDPDLAQN
jgi:hypothetical protein